MKQLIMELIRQKMRLIFTVSALLLLNVALGAVVVFYQQPALADLQTRWSALRRQDATVGAVDGATLYRQAETDLKTVNSRIPEKREFGRILSELYEAATDSAVEVIGISYKPVKIKEEALLSYQLTLSVTGSYAAIKSYLNDLQGMEELIVVDSVS
ncbi:MAG: type 4a pilus biogenesis protein PilO, partial [Desulfuromonadaceae bacterium]|nr:type 4a pilus biogenesis protein PilO [Desulfuromonadaceae bacterium]